MNTIDYIDLVASDRPAEAGEMLVRALMRGEKATLKQGYSLGSALIAAAERYRLTVNELAMVAERVADPKPGIVDE